MDTSFGWKSFATESVRMGTLKVEINDLSEAISERGEKGVPIIVLEKEELLCLLLGLDW
jgi:hypothetical protein